MGDWQCDRALSNLENARKEWRDFKDGRARQDIGRAQREVNRQCGQEGYVVVLPDSREEIFVLPGGQYRYDGRQYGRQDMFTHFGSHRTEQLIAALRRQNAALKGQNNVLMEEVRQLEQLLGYPYGTDTLPGLNGGNGNLPPPPPPSGDFKALE